MDTENKIIVTGGAGFLGSHVVQTLLNSGTKKEDIFVPRSKDYDLRNSGDIKRLLEDFPAETIIHSAARTGGIGFYTKYPATLYRDNLAMGMNLMEQSRLKGIKKFVLIGSGVMYPAAAKVPFKEESIWEGYPDKAAASYGLYNRALLTQSQEYRKEFGFNSLFLIPANLYGPGDYFESEKSHVIPSIISKFQKAKEQNLPEIQMLGSKENSREFIYVEDAAKLIVSAIEHYDSPNPLNLGTGMSNSLEEIVGIISKLIGYKGSITWDLSQQRGASMRRFDITNLEKAIGSYPYTTLEKGLSNTVSWYLENRSNLL